MTRARLASGTARSFVLLLVATFVPAALVMAGGCGADPEAPAPELTDGGDAEASSSMTMTGEAGAARPLGPAVECTIGAAIEEEPNDTPVTANAFTELSFCGVLETGTDVDYFTFATPTGKKLTVFQGVITGKVEFELMLNGATFGPTETDKFGAGTYTGKAFTTSGKPAAYRIRVQFD
jgi:hypothetical protein